jgi:D-glycero-beta-D-manno-heptose-7-phosphate kinase
MVHSTTELRDILQRIREHRFLVVGDLYLDSYIFGQPARVSREAPIMVLEETRREDRPGGGCAPALALAKLGASVKQVGITGNDVEGALLVDLLRANDIDVSGVLVDDERPTTVKTRIVAEGAFNVFPQQVSRIDRQERSSLGQDIEQQLTRQIERIAPDVDAIILSDYRSGVVTARVIETVRQSSTLTTVDSQGALRGFAGLDLIKCNQAEAEQVLGQKLSDRGTRHRLLTELQRSLNTKRLIVTLGAEGAAISSKSVGYEELPPPDRQQVFDVTGAGDTVIAILTAGLAAGGSDLQSLHLSQVAAGVVIARWGNAQASLDDLLDELNEDGDAGAL